MNIENIKVTYLKSVSSEVISNLKRKGLALNDQYFQESAKNGRLFGAFKVEESRRGLWFINSNQGKKLIKASIDCEDMKDFKIKLKKINKES